MDKEDFSTVVGSQIKNLVQTLNKKNYRANVSEIEKLIQNYGYEAYRFLLRFLLKEINFYNISQKDQLKIQLLTQEFAQLTTKTNFTSLIVEVFEGVTSKSEFLSQLSRTLSLPLSQQVLIGLALAQSNDSTTQQEGINFLKTKIPEILDTGRTALPENIVHHLLYFVTITPDFAKDKEKILKAFEGQQQTQVTMAPLFTNVNDVVDSKRSFSSNGQSENTKELVQELSNAVSIGGVIKELGYSATSSVESLNEILSQFNKITEQDVARIVGMMVNTHTGLESKSGQQQDKEKPKSWNVEVLVNVLKKKVPSLNWKQVIRSLDYPGFILQDQKGFAMLTMIYRLAEQGKTFPVDCIVGCVWENKAGQLSILTLALDAPPDVINFAEASSRKVLFDNTQNSIWSSLDLIETLLKLAEGPENYNTVRKIFETPIKHFPEILVIALAQVNLQTTSILYKELLGLLLPVFIKSHKNSTIVLQQILNVNQPLLLNALVETYIKDPSSIRRILTIAQELKLLGAILKVKPFRFTIELAALAAKRDHINLEKWLTNQIIEHGNPFVQECINFIREKQDSRNEQDQLILPPESVGLFLKALQFYATSTKNPAPELIEQIKGLFKHVDPKIKTEVNTGEYQISEEIEKTASQFFEELFTGKRSVDNAIQVMKTLKSSNKPQDQELFTCIIHNLFDEYRFFQQYPPHVLRIVAQLFGAIIQHNIIYSKTLRYALLYILQSLSTPANVKMFQFGLIALNEFKTKLSEFPQFCSHIQNIPQVMQSLPDIALYMGKVGQRTEQQIHGNTVMQGIPVQNVQIQNQPLQNVPNVQQKIQNGTPVAQVVRSSITPNSEIVQTSGAEQGIRVVPGAKNVTISNLQAAVNQQQQQESKPSAIQQQTTQQNVQQTTQQAEKQQTTGTPTPSTQGFGYTMDISTLQKSEQELEIKQPEEKLMDKMHFIINNVSMQNLKDKANEMAGILKPEYHRYLASYMVVNRASLEPNNHKLYIEFLDALKNKDLFNEVLLMTYVNIKKLLNSARITTDLSERSLLKNLGSWLGLLTIAKNRMILKKDLDLKELLFDAYETGKLTAVIPFVHKVLECCTMSKVIKPPNPWVMGILSLLEEIHRMQDLKLNLKFEVEVLMNNLKLNPAEIEVKGQLTDRKVDKGPQNRDWIQQQPVVQPKEGEKVLKIKPVPDFPVIISGLKSLVKISDSIQLFKDYPQFKNLVAVAVDRAIRDIIAPVVQRSVTIACRTTTELVTKDFVYEPDENKLQHAANMMVQNLAANLAMVTCRDPLKIKIETLLIALLESVIEDPENVLRSKIEQAAQIVSADNYELGCAYIEKAATDKAAIEIGESLAGEIESRRKLQRSPWTGYIATRNLPDGLLSENGLHPYQLSVYEDFSKSTRYSQQNGGKEKEPKPEVGKETPQEIGAEKEKIIQLSPKVAFEKISICLDDIEKAAKKLKKNTPLHSLPPDGIIVKRLVIIQKLVQSTGPHIYDTAIAVVQRAMQKLYESDGRLMMEICLLILESTKDVCNKVLIQLTIWWASLDENKKFHKEITIGLIRSSLLILTELDTQIVRALMENNKKALNLAISILKKCIVDEPIIRVYDIRKTFDFLSKNIQKFQKEVPNLKELLEKAALVTKTKKSISPEVTPQQDSMISHFREWLNIVHQQNVEKKVQFIQNLQHYGFIKDGEFEKLCKVFMEISVENFKAMSKQSFFQSPEERIPNEILFKHVDAFSELVAIILKSITDQKLRVTFLTKALSTVAKCLKKDYELQQDKFNQRPYFRFFSNLLIDMNAGDNPNLPILIAFSNCFTSLQPKILPGFAFAWLELISHRMFMPKLLFTKNTKGWTQFHNLLIILFRFLEPYLRNAELNDPIRLLYRGTLKILLVLLHDFSEFLCNYHFSLCDVIPPSCIQMRNLILSAFPRHMRLPDPFTPNLKVDLLPEINQAPKILSKFTAALDKSKLREKVDAYLKNRRPSSFLTELKSKLLLPTQEALACGTRYNVPLINSLVLYVGTQAINQLQSAQTRLPLVNSAAMDIYQKLVLDLDAEGRYLFLNALANQLRYPNNHTHYFSCVLLYLFAEVHLDHDQEMIQEQITRVLLERLIVNRPHPWGLLITFIELVKNPRYNFWGRHFIHCAPEIERLFENVERSCLGTTHHQKTAS